MPINTIAEMSSTEPLVAKWTFMLHLIRKNWREIGRPVGFLPFAYHLVARAVQVVSRGGIRFIAWRIYVQPLAASEVSLRPGYCFVEVEPGNPLEELARRPGAVIQNRRNLGYRCFALLYKDEPVAYAWFATGGDYHDDELRLRFVMSKEAGIVWDFDVFVVPKWRAGRAFQQLWLSCSKALVNEGFALSASRIHFDNVGSILSHQRMGARIHASLLALKIGTLELSFCSRPASIGISIRDRSEVIVEVSSR